MALGFGAGAYGLLVPQSPGNPNGDAYIGQPGSVYDKAANPPRTAGVVTYNPYAPLPPQANASTATPMPAAPAPAR